MCLVSNFNVIHGVLQVTEVSQDEGSASVSRADPGVEFQWAGRSLGIKPQGPRFTTFCTFIGFPCPLLLSSPFSSPQLSRKVAWVREIRTCA